MQPKNGRNRYQNNAICLMVSFLLDVSVFRVFVYVFVFFSDCCCRVMRSGIVAALFFVFLVVVVVAAVVVVSCDVGDGGWRC